MSLLFGANANDEIVTGAFSMPAAVTIACFFTRTDGSATAPRIVDHADLLFFYNQDDDVFRLWRYWSGGTGAWDWSSTAAGGVGHSLILTYDGSSASNDPILYLNNSALTLTSDGNTTGSIQTTSAACSIGNRPGHDRAWSGKLERLVIWNSILSESERAAYHEGTDPATIQAANRVIHLPMLTDQTELILSGETWTGTPTSSTVLAPSGVGTGGPFPARYFAEEYWARRYFPGSYNDGAATSSEWIPKIWIM